MTLEQDLEALSRDESFKPTVYAMNTLLLQKGIYTPEEFEAYFCPHAGNRLRKNAASRALGISSRSVPAIP